MIKRRRWTTPLPNCVSAAANVPSLLNDIAKAQAELATARDLDALRFRCDRRLNEIIRQQAVGNVAWQMGERR